MMLWLHDHAAVNGLFNIGSGAARSFADLAAAVYRALGREPQIEFVDTPAEIRDKYQYFTEARMERLRAAGYDRPTTPLEEGVRAYVQDLSRRAGPLSLNTVAPMLVIPFPDIHPEIFSFGPFVVDHWSIGPFAVRWYALAYIAGLIIGWRYCLALAQRPPQVARPQDVDDFLVWATLGVVLGGRTGYVLFYNLPYYLQHPVEIFFLWRGGMSFHGGALGVCVAILLFCRLRRIRLLAFADIIVAAVPIGLFFGRIANFINGELWGRPTDVPWAMIFPNDPTHLPRHPSQLYESFLEGIVLFLVLWVMQRRGARQRPGLICGVFLTGYGLARIIVEFFRQPDAQLGYLLGNASLGLTMGQLLSLPLVIIGLWLALRAKPAAAPV